jgi:hypothetical protein
VGWPDLGEWDGETMDPEHPVVKLCLAGIEAETEGKAEKARDLFAQAWAAADDDYYACLAAHMVARYQITAEETLRWNEEALKRADAVGGPRVEGFYPSLLLNLGYAHELLGNLSESRKCYREAALKADVLVQNAYGDTVRGGIAEGLRRTGAQE